MRHVRLMWCMALALVAGLALAQPAGLPAAESAAPAVVEPAPAVPALPATTEIAPAPVAAPPIEPPGTPAQPTPPLQPQVSGATLPPPIVLPPPPCVTVPARQLTAEDLATIALSHQSLLDVARAQDRAAAARVQQARAPLGPQVKVTAGYSRSALPSGVTSTGGGTTGGGGFGQGGGLQVAAAATQLLYDGGHTRAGVSEAKAKECAARINVDQARADTVFVVKLSYYTYLQNLRLVEVSGANVGDQQAHLALAQARLTSGLGLPADVVRAQAAVADAIYQLTSAQVTAKISQVTLATQAGIDPRTPLPIDTGSEAPVALDDLNALVQSALENRPEAKQLRADLQAAQYALVVARTNNKPSVSATAGLAGTTSSVANRAVTMLLGVSAQWEVFDSGLTSGLVKEAQANLEATQAQLVGESETIVSDVSQAYLTAIGAQQKVTTAQAEVANARESLRLADGRYRAGAGIFLDVLDAQSAVVTANTNLVNAQAAVDQTIVTLVHAIGTCIPDVTGAPK